MIFVTEGVIYQSYTLNKKHRFLCEKTKQHTQFITNLSFLAKKIAE